MSELVNNNRIFSVNENIVTKLQDRNFVEVLHKIKSFKYQLVINSIRYTLHKGEEKITNKIGRRILIDDSQFEKGFSEVKSLKCKR